jgi:hypothetical protein
MTLHFIPPQLLSYALHRQSVLVDGIKLNEEKGYSAYLYMLEGYCIIDQQARYDQMRLFMNVGCIIVIIAIVIASPVILVAVHDRICKYLKGNKLFFAWSLLLVSSIAASIMFVHDGITIYRGLWGIGDLMLYFWIFAFLHAALPCLDLLSMICALVYLRPYQRERFPIPELFKFINKLIKVPCSCGRQCAAQNGEENLQQQRVPLLDEDGAAQNEAENQQQQREPEDGTAQNEAENQQQQREPLFGRQVERKRGWCTVLCCSECLVLLFGMVFFSLFLQLSSFHSMYILLGAISTPVGTISITTFYIACLFSLIAVVAIALKSTNNPDYYKWDTFKWINVFKCILPILVAVLLFASMGLFIAYFYNYIQSFSNHGGYLVLIGNILPSAVVGLGGFFSSRLIKYIEDPAGQNVQPEQAPPPPAQPAQAPPPPAQAAQAPPPPAQPAQAPPPPAQAAQAPPPPAQPAQAPPPPAQAAQAPPPPAQPAQAPPPPAQPVQAPPPPAQPAQAPPPPALKAGP